MDIKESLPDYRNWSNADFHAALKARTPMFGSTVYSWVRQKAYLRWALAALSASPFADPSRCARRTARVSLSRTSCRSAFMQAHPGKPYSEPRLSTWLAMTSTSEHDRRYLWT